MELQINHTSVFSRNLNEYESGKRFIINQGGSRSSKTYSIVQLLIFLCLTNPNLKVSIIRKSFPSLRGSVLKDFIEIMEDLNLYNESNHNKTEQSYKFFNGSYLEFFSIDNPQKVRGRKRDICYCNEANELDFEDFQQLSLRTNKCLFIDFNPSDTEHWLYDLLKDERSILIKSTYKDNNYLSKEIVQEIENLINVDENYYKIYALGERPISTSRIYSHFKQYIDEPQIDDWCYGVDVGYNHFLALIKIKYSGEKIYVEELLYENKLTISDFLVRIKSLVNDRQPIYVDSARPDVIEELRRAGYNSKSSNKQVKEGIDYVKSKEIYIHTESINLWREYKLYSWKSKGDQIFDEPIKMNDDCFTGDTLITTINGYVPIKDIKIGDYVLTSKGYKKVLLNHNIGERLVKKYWMKTDTSNIYIEATSEHKIKLLEGWKEISQLQSGMIIYLDKNLTGLFTNYTQAEDILKTIGQCTKEFGNIIMEKDQKDSIFTTKMKTLGITDQKISNSLCQMNIYPNIQGKDLEKIQSGSENFSQWELNQQKNGIDPKKVSSGISNTELNLGKIENIDNLSVLNVEKNLNQDIVESLNTVIITARLELVEEIGSSMQRVYDLTVEDDHEYFANGLLVHNCMDALRYGIFTHKKKKFNSEYTKIFVV